MSTPTPQWTTLIVLCLNICNFISQQSFTNFGNFAMGANSSLGVFGDLQNDGIFSSSTGDISIVGSTLQSIKGTNVIRVGNLFLDNNVKLDNELQVKNTLNFNSGIITTDNGDNATEFVHFLEGSSYSGASATKCVNGVVRKTGNTSFDFPIGNNGLYRQLGISAPSLATDHFTAHYTNADPHSAGFNHGAKEATIDHISNCEYWILDRTNGTSNTTVTLSYDNLGSAACSGVTNQSDLIVTKWDGSSWKNLGNSATTGTPSAGNITTFGSVTSFSPFTLGSTSSNNPLPVELLSFDATENQDNVLITWETASELNSDYFTIQKSKDLINWEDLTEVKAYGNSSSTIKYQEIDYTPFGGTSYYRLKQVDYDGEFKHSKSSAVNFQLQVINDYLLYPNPTSGDVTIVLGKNISNLFYLTNSLGQKIDIQPFLNSINENQITLNLKSLPKGLYYISNNQSKISKLIIQ